MENMLSPKWPLIGNEILLTQLEKDIKKKSFASAYLLSGPKDIGKWESAQFFAGRIICPNDFCLRCPPCKQILANTHPDFVILADNGETIKIEDIRRLISKVNLTPQGENKIFLLQNIERMTLEAANSFLKTLEEPPRNTIFVATTENWRMLLPTIVSRMRIFKFSAPSKEAVKNYILQKFPEIDKENLDHTLMYSMFRPIKAIKFLSDPEKFSEEKNFYFNLIKILGTNDIIETFNFFEEIHKDSDKTKLFLAYLEFHLINELRRQETIENIDALKSGLEALDYLDEARLLLKQNVNVKLLLENFFIKFKFSKLS